MSLQRLENRKIDMAALCCDEMKKYCHKMDGVSFQIGEGEISGFINAIEEYHDRNDCLFSVAFDDGWNSYPELMIRFCPFCGKNLMPEIGEE